MNSTVDEVDANAGDGACATAAAGECTLRAAVQETNALPGADTVTIPAGTYDLTIQGAFDETAAAGALDITDDLQIRGGGAADTVIDGGLFSGADLLDVAFDVHMGSEAAISGVTIQRAGHVGSPGGGILNQGTLTLDRTVLTRNRANRGAGILNFGGTLTITDSSFIDNHGGTGLSSGGGILNSGLGVMTLTGVEFIDNTAGIHGGAITNVGTATLIRVTMRNNLVGLGLGGAIFNGNLLTISDSIIAGNHGSIFNEETATLAAINTSISGNRGSAILNYGNATLTNVTITGNSSRGIYHDLTTASEPRSLIVINSIISNNYGIVTGEAGGDCGGPSVSAIISAGHNLASDDTCPFSGPGDLTNTDPLLDALADNGGTTETHALLPGSPAIDAGDNSACPQTDQRGLLRPADGNQDGEAVCDMGAYEAGALPFAPTPTASPTTAPSPTPMPTRLASPGQEPGPTGRLPSALPRTGGNPDTAAKWWLGALGAFIAAALPLAAIGAASLYASRR